MQAGEHPYLTAFGMIPAHRDLHGSEPQFTCDKQNLHVESEAFERLAGKDPVGRFGAENFEPALRIGKRQTGGRAHHKVEKLARGLTEARLVHADQRPVERARANRNVGVASLQGLPQLVQLFDWGGEIGIRKKPPIAARLLHPVSNGIAFASITGILQYANIPVTVGELRRGLHRLVRRAVINDENLVKPPVGSGEIFFNPPQSIWQTRLFVVSRHND